ncbi:MAG: peptidoglycan-binding domain-containing protein [Candidatus Pacebacteria bacterium]|nr:peptidoglycan-binding domain-containing protein [Candidatus Paceibacterota bacterium]
MEKSFDAEERLQVSATLKTISNNGYFYVEDIWYRNLTPEQQKTFDAGLSAMTNEFETTIYPQLTTIYGAEWKPGIDNDPRVTVLMHQMRKGAAGYFRTQDEMPALQAPGSNEREMVYLNAQAPFYDLAKSYLAHEFTHLITYNQKDRLRGVEEEVWLNEARAEYAPTLLGYNDEYQGSYLEQRVKNFIDNPRDSITEWTGVEDDYGALDVFMHYFTERYGVGVLADSLRSRSKGIVSLDASLKKYGFDKSFAEIFTDWTIAVFLNDCSFGPDYCFQRQSLRKVKVAPSLVLLPNVQESNFGLTYPAKPWGGSWYRFMGGTGRLDLQFQDDSKVAFKIPYVLCPSNGVCSINYLNLDQNGTGRLSFADFSGEFSSLTLIPSIQSKIQGFDGLEPSYNFSLLLKTKDEQSEARRIAQLEQQLAELQDKIIQVKAQITRLLAQKSMPADCRPAFEQTILLGSSGDSVKCLQEFLSEQGSDIYPEGIISGFFGTLTRQAVIRFQQKYASEILAPLGVSAPTGVVGPATLAKIKTLL